MPADLLGFRPMNDTWEAAVWATCQTCKKRWKVKGTRGFAAFTPYGGHTKATICPKCGATEASLSWPPKET